MLACTYHSYQILKVSGWNMTHFTLMWWGLLSWVRQVQLEVLI